MEAATVARQAPPDPAPVHDGEAEATRTTEELFQWSAYVHAGAGAEECEHAEDGQCQDAWPRGKHFHCWVTLPNTFQARDITEKALAAKARRRRTLTQDGSDGGEPSDAYLTLAEGLEAWTLNDKTWDALLSRIADRRVQAEQPEITRRLLDDDRFEHYPADLEEYRRQGTLPEEERDQETWERLTRDMDDFRKAFEESCTSMFDRERDVLKGTPRHEVLDIERRYMVDQSAIEQFNHTYYTWAYYVCALKPVGDGYPTERIFSKPEELRGCPPEAFARLRDAYRSLENRFFGRGDVAGN